MRRGTSVRPTTITGVTNSIQYYADTVAEMTAEGAPFEMNEVEVRGIPMRVFKAAPGSMRDIWEMTTPYGDTPYIVFEDERYSYNDIHARVRVLAHALRNDHGVGSGDRVAVSMRNYPEWVISYWAIVSIGAAVVGMNAWWTGPEMKFGLADSAPKVLITDDERFDRIVTELDELRATSPLHVMVTRYEGDLPDDASRWSDVVSAPFAAGNVPDALPEATIDPDDDATIFYTSGTTGFPKGAQLTHRGSVHNLFNLAFMRAAIEGATTRGRVARGEALPEPAAPGQAVFMAPTPLFHVTACNCLFHPATLTGSKLVLTYKWNPRRALELIEREGVTNFSGVPTMSRELLLHPDWATRDTSSLTGMGGGGAALQPDLVEKINDATGSGDEKTAGTGYGLTETHGIVTANSGEFFAAKPASAGPLVPTLDAKLIDDEGNDLAPGSRGQLCVRGTVVIKGYINRKEATAEAIRDGWFNTGDIAEIDEDGFIYIVDRAKDMVIRGGENIYCSEVESAIYSHEAIAECAVFGLDDERLGEEVACAILLKDGAEMSIEDLQSFLAPMLAKPKIPSKVWFRSEPIPQNANGKFLKRDLREQYAD